MTHEAAGLLGLCCALPVLAHAPNSRPVFFAMSDKPGPYLRVEAAGPVEKQFGEAARAGKFRRCP